ncbi:MAG: hypothetical protein ACOH1T_00770 [Microbacteriaceae bacterium]
MTLFPVDPPADSSGAAPSFAAPSFAAPSYSAPAQQPPPPPPPPPKRPRGSRRRRTGLIATILVVLLLITATIVAFQQRGNIRDFFIVANYEAPAAVEEYITRSTMTERAAFVFKASVPEIGDASAVNDRCSSHEPGVGVLGCFVSTDRSILLYDVTDKRLDGIEEVVAAHELLHAVWYRMSPSERREVGALLTEAAAQQNEAFHTRLSVYDNLPESGRLNELHSIIGTEVAQIPAALETYYSRWFTDRAALVDLHLTSNAVFEDIQKRTDALVAELDKLRDGIEGDSKKYNSGYDSLNNDIESFNRRADSGAFGSTQQFDRERNALLSRQRTLDLLLVDIRKRSKIFDGKQADLAKLNAQVAELNKGLNILPVEKDPSIEE